MGTRTRWIVAARTFAVSEVIIGSVIAQAIRQRSLDPAWMVGWLPGVLAGGGPGADRARQTGARPLPAPAAALGRLLSNRESR